MGCCRIAIGISDQHLQSVQRPRGPASFQIIKYLYVCKDKLPTTQLLYIAEVTAQEWTNCNEETKHLTFSIVLPSFIVGLADGGTACPTLKEALEDICCAGPGQKWALAETMAAFTLALDVSTSSLVASSTKAASHRRLVRESNLGRCGK